MSYFKEPGTTVRAQHANIFSGKLRAHTIIGGYPIYYICADGGTLCSECADCDRCKQADDNPDDKQWHLVDVDVNCKDRDLRCSNCNAPIECLN